MKYQRSANSHGQKAGLLAARESGMGNGECLLKSMEFLYGGIKCFTQHCEVAVEWWHKC